MSRDITASVQTELGQSVVEPVIFVKLEFDSGDTLLWSGIGTITWDAQNWLGVGALGKLSPIQETNDIQADGVEMTLNGIPSGYVAAALTENYTGRPVTIWLGFMAGTSIVSDPVQVFSGKMDIMNLDEGGETATIVVTAENRLIDLLRPRERRYTHEDQQIAYPGDKGLEFVAGLQEKEITWGPR